MSSTTEGIIAGLLREFANTANEPVIRAPRECQLFESTRMFVREGYKEVDLTESLARLRPNPQRRAGCTELHTLESFIDFSRRMADRPRTVLFADFKKYKLVAVFNYHDPVCHGLTKLQLDHQQVPTRSIPESPDVADDIGPEPAEPFREAHVMDDGFIVPQWGDYRAHYDFPFSRQWKIWNSIHKKSLTQLELADFIETNIRDIRHEHPPLPPELAEIVGPLGLSVGTPQRLLEVARGFTLSTDETVRNIINTSTGETQVLYNVEHNQNTKSSGTISVPTAFVIGIPVFNGDAPYRLLCRLRYAKSGDKVNWKIDIQSLDLALEHAFNSGAKSAALEADLPLFFGEAPATAPIGAA